ncbi:hypothetical protein ABVV53_07665 [Novosphingobium sp. RD2P27]|uniref:Uncharacterized protein n=1 Tax=Novosphingobium kalidii TaxID=3230299 RepID=A0ABV2D1X3_9SPHN
MGEVGKAVNTANNYITYMEHSLASLHMNLAKCRAAGFPHR